MSEGFIMGVGLALLVGVPLLGGILIGQLSVWNWLHKRYGVAKKEPFYEWLDGELERAGRYQKGWEDFTEALDSVGREP